MFRGPGLPPAAAVAAALALGTLFGEFLPGAEGVLLAAAWLLAVLLFVSLSRRFRMHRPHRSRCLLLMTVACLSAVRWQIDSRQMDCSHLARLAERDDTVVLTVDVTSVPFAFRRPNPAIGDGRPDQTWQTRFTASCRSMELAGRSVPLKGRLRVFVDGQAAARCGRGDTVRVIGRLSRPEPPGNPGQFDFARFLKHRRVAALLSVRHPQAVSVLKAAGPLHPGTWLTALRRSAQQALMSAVSDDNQAIAMALLLGSRTEVRPEIQDVFIGSGTMHLLAISGLHLGILWLLLVRIGHALLIPWNPRLILIALICIAYALLTDLRPSIVRATVFTLLFTLAQISVRQVSLTAVLSLTACVMLLVRPGLVFDTGAWLSFLSVIGLVCAGSGGVFLPGIGQPTRRDVSWQPLTRSERMRDGLVRSGQWFLSRCHPMLWILAATVPVTAAEFHVISPVTLVVNVLLITWTMFTLWTGFAAVLFGMLLPALPNPAGAVFSAMLTGLRAGVQAAGGPGPGHLYLPDLPVWFLPAWYILLTAAVLFPSFRRLTWTALILLVSVLLHTARTVPDSSGLTCTILDVGHGSAAVVEFPNGRTLLVDAGSMHRGDRAGEIIYRYLWSRGRRTVSSVLVSHDDIDHFNGLQKVFSRFPVGELLLSPHFLQSRSSAASDLRRTAARYHVPIRSIAHGDICRMDGVRLDILQAEAVWSGPDLSDNEMSLVVLLEFAGRRICLPGDLEVRGAQQLLPRLPRVDVLVSPHHGSRRANTPETARVLQPRHLVVSARRTDHPAHLQDVYTSAAVYRTSDSGAVSVQIAADGTLSVSPFRTDAP